jgi:hypothetical protein
MESTLKIATESRGTHLTPIIKIIQPIALVNPDPTEDYDERDKLIANFLHTPCMAERNTLFEVCSHYPHPMNEDAQVYITTIAALEENNFLHRMRWAMIHRYIPHDDIYEFNAIGNKIKSGEQEEWPKEKVSIYMSMWHSINNFFDMLERSERPAWELTHPTITTIERAGKSISKD